MRIILALGLILVSLTSCQVNWGTTSYDVPWYVMAIILSSIIIVALILCGLYIFKHNYICPKCEKEFKPTKWYIPLWTFHFCGSRLFKCPHCKRTSFCHPCFRKKKSESKEDTEKSESSESINGASPMQSECIDGTSPKQSESIELTESTEIIPPTDKHE